MMPVGLSEVTVCFLVLQCDCVSLVDFGEKIMHRGDTYERTAKLGANERPTA